MYVFFFNLRFLLAALTGSLGRFYCSTWRIKGSSNHGAQAAYELVRYQQYVICIDMLICRGVWFAQIVGDFFLSQAAFEKFPAPKKCGHSPETTWRLSLHVEDSSCKIRPIGSWSFLGPTKHRFFTHRLWSQGDDWRMAGPRSVAQNLLQHLLGY